VIIIGVVTFIMLVIALYFTFIYYPTCEGLACFNGKLESCSKTHFLNDAADGVWNYKIKGKSGKSCEIYVEFLQAKVGEVEVANLEGKSMVCFTPLGTLISPQSDLKNCHGILKEEMQNLIIKKMHSYLMDNLGAVQDGLMGI